MYWKQPGNLLFEDIEGKSGGYLAFQLKPDNTKWYKPYIELEAKSKGWLAGNPFQRSKAGFRLGFSALLK